MSILKPFALTQLQAHLKTGEICIILSGEEKTRNHDVHYPFRASSHFKYFCTLNETDCALVIEKTHKGLKINLFKKPYDAHSALWTSGRMPLNQAKEDPLIEDVALFEQFPTFLQSLPTGGNIFSDPHALIEIKTLPLNQIMGKCRMLKKDAELSDIQKAIYLDGIEPTVYEQYKPYVEKWGIDFAEFLTKTKEAIFVAKTNAGFRQSSNFGVSGFPTVILSQKGKKKVLVEGYASLEQLQAQLVSASKR